MVWRDLGEEQFKQALRVHFPDLPEDFELCKVNSQRQIIPLQLESFTPDQIHSDNALGRSALYTHLKVSKLLYNIYKILKYSKHGCTARRYGMILDSKWFIDARTIIHGLHKFYACILLTTNKCLSI